MSVILCLFVRGRSRFQPPEMIAGVLRFIGRHTLEIYAIQPCGLRNHRMVCAQSRTLIMIVRDPIKNFEFLWKTFLDRYPFFELRKVDWKQQFEIYRAKVTNKTNDDELFEIFCDMLGPLNDGHVELIAKTSRKGKRRHFRPEKKPRFHQEFGKREIEQLFKTTGKTLVDNGFALPKETEAWMLHYSRSREFGYIRILELEGIKKERLTAALDKIARDFNELKGIIIDIRDNPGGDDSTAITIINRFCDQQACRLSQEDQDRTREG